MLSRHIVQQEVAQVFMIDSWRRSEKKERERERQLWWEANNETMRKEKKIF